MQLLFFKIVHISGGITLTISGYGFKTGAVVSINAASCQVTAIQTDAIECVVPAMVRQFHEVPMKCVAALRMKVIRRHIHVYLKKQKKKEFQNGSIFFVGIS